MKLNVLIALFFFASTTTIYATEYTLNIKSNKYNNGNIETFTSSPIPTNALPLSNFMAGKADKLPVPYTLLKRGEDGNIYMAWAAPDTTGQKKYSISIWLMLYDTTTNKLGIPKQILSFVPKNKNCSPKFDMYVQNDENIYFLFNDKPLFFIIGLKDGKEYTDKVSGKKFNKYANNITDFGGFSYYDDNFSLYFKIPNYKKKKKTIPMVIIQTEDIGEKWKEWKPLQVSENSESLLKTLSAGLKGYSSLIYKQNGQEINGEINYIDGTQTGSSFYLDMGTQYITNTSDEYTEQGTIAASLSLKENNGSYTPYIVNYPVDKGKGFPKDPKLYPLSGITTNDQVIGIVVSEADAAAESYEDAIAFYSPDSNSILIKGKYKGQRDIPPLSYTDIVPACNISILKNGNYFLIGSLVFTDNQYRAFFIKVMIEIP
jgi:hypothetical protein